MTTEKWYDVQEYKKKLDALSVATSKAYFDSAMFLSIVQIANSERRSNFLFDYSYYSIRERAVIAVKSIIEPKGKDRLTLEKVIKDLRVWPEYRQFSDKIYTKYIELFDSEGAKRIKDFRDALCHNLEDNPNRVFYCKDIMNLIGDIMDIINSIYRYVFNTRNSDFDKILHISTILANDYWGAICEQADKMPDRRQELTELQRILNSEKK